MLSCKQNELNPATEQYVSITCYFKLISVRGSYMRNILLYVLLCSERTIFSSRPIYYVSIAEAQEPNPVETVVVFISNSL